jgi:hypothetical protein
MPTETTPQVIQFHVIRRPDRMVGSRNDGGADLLFFSLDSSGQLWRGVAPDAGGQPAWSKVDGPLEAPHTVG